MGLGMPDHEVEKPGGLKAEEDRLERPCPLEEPGNVKGSVLGIFAKDTSLLTLMQTRTIFAHCKPSNYFTFLNRYQDHGSRPKKPDLPPLGRPTEPSSRGGVSHSCSRVRDRSSAQLTGDRCGLKS